MGLLDFFRRKTPVKSITSNPHVLSREEFVAKLAQMTNSKTINEDAELDGNTMVELSILAAYQFRKSFYGMKKSTVRELIDDLYQQYLRE